VITVILCSTWKLAVLRSVLKIKDREPRVEKGVVIVDSGKASILDTERFIDGD